LIGCGWRRGADQAKSRLGVVGGSGWMKPPAVADQFLRAQQPIIRSRRLGVLTG